MVPGTGVEPALLSELDPKSSASANSAIRACIDQSGTYYALVRRSGKQIRRSLKTKDHKLAERRLSEFRKDIGLESASPEERRMSFAQVGESWLKIATAALKPASAEQHPIYLSCLCALNDIFTIIPNLS